MTKTAGICKSEEETEGRQRDTNQSGEWKPYSGLKNVWSRISRWILSGNGSQRNCLERIRKSWSRRQQICTYQVPHRHRNQRYKKLQKYAFIITRSSTKQRKSTPEGWEVCIQWKDISTTWKNINISRIRIQYKWQSTQLRIESWRIQHSHGELKTCWIKDTK